MKTYKKPKVAKGLLSALTLLIVLVFSMQLSFSRDIYVSPTGSDSNNGLSPSSPIKTLIKARDICEGYLNFPLSGFF